jgi:large subunit ribosomal protein L17
MLRNLAKSLLAHKRITTTETRAKELTRFIAGLITFAKRAHAAESPSVKLANKRQVFRDLAGAPRVGDSRPDRDLCQELFEQVAVKFSEGEDKRDGGYTRIIRLAPRKGDGAPMALIEFV